MFEVPLAYLMEPGSYSSFRLQRDGKDRSSKNDAFVERVADQNVRLTVETIRAKSPVLKEMEDKGEIKIVGAMYDVKTGKVEWYDSAPAANAAAAGKKL